MRVVRLVMVSIAGLFLAVTLASVYFGSEGSSRDRVLATQTPSPSAVQGLDFQCEPEDMAVSREFLHDMSLPGTKSASEAVDQQLASERSPLVDPDRRDSYERMQTSQDMSTEAGTEKKVIFEFRKHASGEDALVARSVVLESAGTYYISELSGCQMVLHDPEEVRMQQEAARKAAQP